MRSWPLLGTLVDGYASSYDTRHSRQDIQRMAQRARGLGDREELHMQFDRPQVSDAHSLLQVAKSRLLLVYQDEEVDKRE